MKKYLLTLLFVSLLINCGKKEEPKADASTATATATAPAADPAAKGKELFSLNCASCHGETGAGDGAAAAALNPKPRNYKAPAKDWKNGKTLAGITKTLNEGIKNTTMVSYKHLADQDPTAIEALANYVLKLGEDEKK